MAGRTLIDHGRLLRVWGDEVEILIESSHETPSDLRVRTCPGWTVGELLRHLGSVFRATLAWLAGGQRPREWQRDPAPGQTVESYLREGFVDLREVLTWHTPDKVAASWWPADRTYGFWVRRMAHETTIHRFDVVDTVDLTGPEIAEDVAADGIDEALALWFGYRLPLLGLSGTRRSSVGVRAGAHSWIARAGPGETVAWRCSAHEAEQADAVVSGSAVQLYLWLWGRTRLGSVAVDRDEDAVGQLWALMRLATK